MCMWPPLLVSETLSFQVLDDEAFFHLVGIFVVLDNNGIYDSRLWEDDSS